MSAFIVTNALQNPEFRNTMSPAERDHIPAASAGIMEVGDTVLATASGGGFAEILAAIKSFFSSGEGTTTIVVTVGTGNSPTVGDNNGVAPAPAPKKAPPKPAPPKNPDCGCK
jgi:mersacidin/lichenicidin family type 2 lantibiotic